ncbi:hypothetical protein EC988_007110, partial [Linderina pennispora]
KPIYYVIAGLSLANIPFILYIIAFRNYLPIKVKNVWVTSLIGLGSTFFNVSYGPVSGSSGYSGIFSNCYFWLAWAFQLFGLGILHSALLLRLIVYYRVFIRRTSFRRSGNRLANFWHKYWPFFLILFPYLFSTILSHALKDKFAVITMEVFGTKICTYTESVAYYLIGYYYILVLVGLFLYLSMRKVAKAFNEFKLALWTVTTFALNVIVETALLFTGSSIYAWGRLLPTILLFVTYQTHFYCIILVPIYNHIFRREDAVKELLDDMRQDGILAKKVHIGNIHRNLYNVDNTNSSFLGSARQDSKMGESSTGNMESVPGSGFP